MSGPSVAQGYWGRPDETRVTFGAHLSGGAGPYLRTGDLGFLSDKELLVTGRLKDLIIVNGRNILPADLETECARIFGDPAGCVQAAFEMAEGSVVVVAEVDPVRDDVAQPGADSARERIAASYSLHPFSIVLVRRGSIPRTTSGKVRRKATRDRLTAGELTVLLSSGPSPWSTGKRPVDS